MFTDITVISTGNYNNKTKTENLIYGFQKLLIFVFCFSFFLSLLEKAKIVFVFFRQPTITFGHISHYTQHNKLASDKLVIPVQYN